jgi:hypothetical protein
MTRHQEAAVRSGSPAAAAVVVLGAALLVGATRGLPTAPLQSGEGEP